MIAYVPLSRGMWARVDQEDLPLLLEYVWSADPSSSGKYRARGHRRGDKTQKKIYMHQLLTGYQRTDHWDREPLNNVRTNLRPATHTENMRNVSPRTETGIVGVVWSKTKGRYIASLRIGPSGSNKLYSKSFRNIEDAVKHRKHLEDRFWSNNESSGN